MKVRELIQDLMAYDDQDHEVYFINECADNGRTLVGIDTPVKKKAWYSNWSGFLWPVERQNPAPMDAKTTDCCVL